MNTFIRPRIIALAFLLCPILACRNGTLFSFNDKTYASASEPARSTFYVTLDGKNSNPCTQSSPCATPDFVVNHRAAPGDSVIVAPGIYDFGKNSVHFVRSGAPGRPITVSCATRDACVLLNQVTGNQTVVQIDATSFALDGFEITNSNPRGNNVGLYITHPFVTVSHNKIHGIETDCREVGGGGIQLASTADHVTIDGNLIYDISWPEGKPPRCSDKTVQTDGILAETPGEGIVITNNIVHHVSGGWGIMAGASEGGNASPMLIANNLVFDNSNGGIGFTNGGDYSSIVNNIVLYNGSIRPKCGIWTIYASDGHMLEANNDLFGNGGGNICSASRPIQQNNISIDPNLGTTFLNWQRDGRGNYHLKPGSPAVQAGTAGCAESTANPCLPPVDFDGHDRGQVQDIGPFSSVSSRAALAFSPSGLSQYGF